LNGEEVEVAFKNWGIGIKPEDGYPFVIATPEDLVWSAEKSSCLFLNFVEFYRCVCTDKPLVVVLVNDDLASFAASKWLVLALNHLVENADGVIFATPAEVPQVASLFTKATSTESVEQLALMQLTPFPRLHFFTLSTALGSSLEDGEVITPSVTVGTKGGGVPAAKFKQNKGKKTAFFLTGKDWQPLTDRVIPGSAEVTLVHPAKLLGGIFESVCKAVTVEPPEKEKPDKEEGESEEEDCGPVTSWSVFGEEYGEMDDMMLMECYSNINDLKSEYEQYLSSGDD